MLFSVTAAVALAASFLPVATAHTWIEEMQVIGPNGSYIGDRGYTRGYVAPTDPTFDGSANILWLLPSLDARMPDGGVRLRINSSDLLCHPNQRTANYSNPAYPKLKVSPGGYVAMKYLENGHVTLPWNQPGKPAQGGTVFVYGTSQPSDNELIADVLQWTSDGSGGDGRGFLITAQTYDDGRCHQINNCVNSAIRQALFPNKIPNQPTAPGQEQWCETDVKIPSTQTLGDLTMYWVWQWPTDQQCTYPTGKDEYYTACADVTIVDGGTGDSNIADEFAGNTLLQEDFQTKAVSTYAARTALTTSPQVILQNWAEATATPTVAENAAFASSCAIEMSSIAAQAGVPPPSCPAGLWATGALFAEITASVLNAHIDAFVTGPGGATTGPPLGSAFAAPTSGAAVPSSGVPSPVPSAPAIAPPGSSFSQPPAQPSGSQAVPPPPPSGSAAPPPPPPPGSIAPPPPPPPPSQAPEASGVPAASQTPVQSGAPSAPPPPPPPPPPSGSQAGQSGAPTASGVPAPPSLPPAASGQPAASGEPAAPFNSAAPTAPVAPSPPPAANSGAPQPFGATQTLTSFATATSGQPFGSGQTPPPQSQSGSDQGGFGGDDGGDSGFHHFGGGGHFTFHTDSTVAGGPQPTGGFGGGVQQGGGGHFSFQPSATGGEAPPTQSGQPQGFGGGEQSQPSASGQAGGFDGGQQPHFSFQPSATNGGTQPTASSQPGGFSGGEQQQGGEQPGGFQPSSTGAVVAPTPSAQPEQSGGPSFGQEHIARHRRHARQF